MATVDCVQSVLRITLWGTWTLGRQGWAVRKCTLSVGRKKIGYRCKDGVSFGKQNWRLSVSRDTGWSPGIKRHEKW